MAFEAFIPIITLKLKLIIFSGHDSPLPTVQKHKQLG